MYSNWKESKNYNLWVTAPDEFQTPSVSAPKIWDCMTVYIWYSSDNFGDPSQFSGVKCSNDEKSDMDELMSDRLKSQIRIIRWHSDSDHRIYCYWNSHFSDSVSPWPSGGRADLHWSLTRKILSTKVTFKENIQNKYSLSGFKMNNYFLFFLLLFLIDCALGQGDFFFK